MKVKEEPNKNSIELELLECYNKKEDKMEDKKNKLYGNDINIERPKKLGKLRALLYIKDYPLIIIGPHCNQFF